MHYKYQSEIQALPNCPPSQSHPQNVETFRFVFQNINNPQNFLPVYIKKPSRQNEKDSPEKSCDGYGLSLFDTLENARKRYDYLIKRYKKFHLDVGTHIAQGQISQSDGVVSEANEHGHMTLHEYEDTNLSIKFQIITQVYPNGNY